MGMQDTSRELKSKKGCSLKKNESVLLLGVVYHPKPQAISTVQRHNIDSEQITLGTIHSPPRIFQKKKKSKLHSFTKISKSKSHEI